MLTYPSLMLAALLIAQQPTQLKPPQGPFQLAYTHTARDQISMLDLASLQKSGDVVEGWSLGVLREPVEAFSTTPAAVYWMRIRIDCAAHVGRFTHAIGLVEGAVAFSEPVAMSDTQTVNEWALDEQYACEGIAPARPTIADFDTALQGARQIMASDAWDATD